MSDEGPSATTSDVPNRLQESGVPPLAPAPGGGLRTRSPQAVAGPAGTLTWSPPRPVG
jgi:hypothetical protein